ncbi:MAG: DNA polymerase III subunit beta [Candidatus Paceibacterota bacterium]|jgi:DNA polymerase-3 subunit beta
MKLECSIEKLKNAVTQADKITGRNLTLPILNSILLIASGKSLKIRATNLSLGIEVEIPAKIEKEGISAIKGDVLNNLLSSINQGQNITIELENDNLLLKTKNNNVLIKSYPHEDFPTIPIVAGSSFNIPAKKFIEGIKSVYYSSSISDIKPEISSVYIYQDDDQLIFVATDSFRLAEKRIKMKQIDDFGSILIPFKNVTEILRVFNDYNDDLKVCFNKNQISLSSDNIYLTSRIIDGIFPDYKQIIPKEKKTEVVVLKQDLINALKISNIFSDKFNQIIISINPKGKIFQINSKNTDVGENKTNLEASLEGEEIEVNLNFKYLLDCFQSINQDSVILQFNTPNKPLVVKGVSENTFTYLVMPMNR